MNKKAAIYCRLSVEDKNKAKAGDDSESIQNQRLILMEYAKNHNLEIQDIYIDDDYSGLDSHRPAFNKLLENAELGLFDTVICKAQSRFTRDMEFVEKYVHHYFDVWGIRFIGVVDNADTSVKGNKKQRQINGLVNEWYCEDISENVKAVLRSKKKEGLFLGAFAAYGYRKDPNNRHCIIIDDEAAKVVREIFSLYLKGYGCKQIADILTTRKILPPSAYKRSKGLKFSNPNSKKYSEEYGVWANNTVARILDNPLYIGTLIQCREKKVSYKSKKVVIAPKDEWVVCENNHEAIIHKDIFNNVKKLRENRRTTHKSADSTCKPRQKSHVLAGKVKCLDCGSNLNRSAKGRNGEVYLKCQLATKTKKQACTYHTIKLESLTNTVETKIKEIISIFLSEQENMDFKNCLSFEYNTIDSDLSALERECKELSIKIENANWTLSHAYADKLKCEIDENEYSAIKSVFNIDILNYKERQCYIETETNKLLLKKDSLHAINKEVSKHMDFNGLTHEIVNDFIDYIEVGEKNSSDEQIVNIHWLF